MQLKTSSGRSNSHQDIGMNCHAHLGAYFGQKIEIKAAILIRSKTGATIIAALNEM
jgi:hypothetical protein